MVENNSSFYDDEEFIDFIDRLIKEIQLKIYQGLFKQEEEEDDNTFRSFFDESEIKSTIEGEDNRLLETLLLSIKEFDSARWSPQIYTDFVSKTLFILLAILFQVNNFRNIIKNEISQLSISPQISLTNTKLASMANDISIILKQKNQFASNINAIIQKLDIIVNHQTNVEPQVSYPNIDLTNLENSIAILLRNQERISVNVNTTTEQIAIILSNQTNLQEQVDFLVVQNIELTKMMTTLPIRVSNEVIGMPYSRFDSITCHYPSLIFSFSEVSGDHTRRRTSQIIARVDITGIINDDILLQQKMDQFEQDIIKKLPSLYYIYGQNRANFVSKNKLWKTTVYTDSLEGAINVLKSIAEICGYVFDSGDISYTTGRRRSSIYSRQKEFNGIFTNSTNYTTSTYKTELTKVSCYIKNLEYSILIWRKEHAQ